MPTLNSFRQTGLAAIFASRTTRTCIHKDRKYFDRNQCIPEVSPAFKPESAELSEESLLGMKRISKMVTFFFQEALEVPLFPLRL